MKNSTQPDRPGVPADNDPDRDLAQLAQELEGELARLKARLDELEGGAGSAVVNDAEPVDVRADDHADTPAADVAIGPLLQVDVLAVESGPITDAHAAIPPTVRLRVQKTRARRSRRRGRMNFASRVITGSCLAIALSVQPASSVSLWNQAANQAGSTNGNVGLFQPVKQSFRVGDIITIAVNEANEADHQWRAERETDNTIEGTAAPSGDGAGRVNLLGLFFPFMSAGYQSEVTSDNRSDRSVSLRATLAAEVVNVLPNGNLQVVAKKVTRVNSEEQLIELTGNIRPEDISAANIVSSTAIADATIKVNGSLRYTNDNKPGILERIASFLSGLFL